SVDRRRRAVLPVDELARVLGRRELGDVEDVGRLRVLVELVVTEVDRRHVHRHLDHAGLGFLVDRDRAGRRVDLAAPLGETPHVVRLVRRIRVVRVVLVGDGRRRRDAESAAGHAEDDRGTDIVELHVSHSLLWILWPSASGDAPAEAACARPCHEARSTVNPGSPRGYAVYPTIDRPRTGELEAGARGAYSRPWSRSRYSWSCVSFMTGICPNSSSSSVITTWPSRWTWKRARNSVSPYSTHAAIEYEPISPSGPATATAGLGGS